MKLNRFNAEPCGFPKPRVPFLADRAELLPLGKWCSGSSKHDASRHFRHYTCGRYALGEAYRLAGVGHEGELLAPAYHCATMLDPAVGLGANIQLYPLHADLSPDLEKLDELLITSEKPVKALLATHFFGLAQDFSRLRQWCDKHHIVLVEDCSHVLFTERFQAAGTGIYGKFVAASPYKFFTCEDGGLLYSPEDNLLGSIQTESCSWIHELRGLKRTIDKYRSAGPVTSEIALIDRRLEEISANPIPAPEQWITEYSEPSSMYSAAWSRTRSRRSSRFIVDTSSIEENIRVRQNNYRRWAEAVASLPNCHTPFPDLPANCAPYMFPLRIDHPDPHFYWLKRLGVPIWRWEEMAVSSCPIAQDYRLHLLHLPCHQALNAEQMDWMIAALQKTLRHTMQGA